MKASLQQTTRTSQRTILKYTLAGAAVALLVGVGAFFFFNVGMSKTSYAATENEPPIIVSIAAGNWNAPTSWNLNRIPQNGDRVIIKKDHTITYPGGRSIHSFDGEIIVNGEFKLEKILLKMDRNSKVAINEGGRITFSGNYEMLYRNSAINIAGWLGFFGITINTDQAGPVAYGQNAESLLPIELLSFAADMTEDNTVAIRWSTAAEKGNDFFTIERSLDGQNFFVLDTVQGAGDSNKRIEYTYTDPLPVSGYNYYRLKQTDFDGKFEYFNVEAVINDKAESQLSQIYVSPNSFFDEFEVSFHATDNSMVHVKLVDMQGRTILNKSLEIEKGKNSFIYNNDLLQSGIYLFTIVQKGMPAKTFRLVKSSH